MDADYWKSQRHPRQGSEQRLCALAELTIAGLGTRRSWRCERRPGDLAAVVAVEIDPHLGLELAPVVILGRERRRIDGRDRFVGLVGSERRATGEGEEHEAAQHADRAKPP